MSLDDVWKTREGLWQTGTQLIQKGDKLFQEIKTLPGSMRVGIWLSVSEMSAEAAQLICDGYKMRRDADAAWAKALESMAVSLGIPDLKVFWEWDPEKHSNRCRLSTGEIFEP